MSLYSTENRTQDSLCGVREPLAARYLTRYFITTLSHKEHKTLINTRESTYLPTYLNTTKQSPS